MRVIIGRRQLYFAVTCLALLFAAADARAQSCDESDFAVLPSPITPWRGAPLRVLFTAEKPLQGELTLIAPDGSVAARSRERMGGPPYSWIAEVKSPAAGKWRVALTGAGCTREITVQAEMPQRPSGVAGSVWPIRGGWTRANENLFAAWIEKLFDAPLDAELSWPALHVGLRDQSRNFLFNHLGLGEDEMKMVLRPDCADLPYFLRAYFAFKLGLPFGFSKCSRGGGGRGPSCPQWFNIQNADAARQPQTPPLPPPGHPGCAGHAGGAGRTGAAEAAARPRRLVRRIHAHRRRQRPLRLGARRPTPTTTPTTTPCRSSQDTLRPGTIYADPYGHILMLVKRVPQSEGGARCVPRGRRSA